MNPGTQETTEYPSTENKIPTPADNSQNALDWDGIYKGTLPCADCEGIATVLILNKNGSYTHKTKYMGKGDDAVENTGKFSWNTAGSEIQLLGYESVNTQFKVGENQLFMLDQDGQSIVGDLADQYVLRKEDTTITEKYWKLVELNGKTIETKEGQREAFLILKTENDRVHGNGGCNTFNGSYELKDEYNISFSKMATTLMACEDLDTEQQFLTVLETADNYHATETTLSLFKAKMAPLAKFEVEYFR
ncbi:copper resistance protein NlpE N-terminal domain-containing protein [Arenibacter sp. GZD96]|nr:copper resistance protein NlpE N-terminal domain-containing protein [Arenibacter sp. GZD-96]